MFGEEGVESEGECDDEEGADDGELQEGLHHVGEHDHVDAEERKLSNVLKLKTIGNGFCQFFILHITMILVMHYLLIQSEIDKFLKNDSIFEV